MIWRKLWVTRMILCYPGTNYDNRNDIVVEPGKRPGLHWGNTVSVRTGPIFEGKVPRFIIVYWLVVMGTLTRVRTGTVRTRLYNSTS